MSNGLLRTVTRYTPLLRVATPVSVSVSASVLSLPGKEIYVVDVPPQPTPLTPAPLKFAPGSIQAPESHTHTLGMPSASPEPTSPRRGVLR